MRVRELLTAFLLVTALDRIGATARPATARRGRRHRRAGAPAAPPEILAPVRRGPLFVLMLASAGIAVPLMLIFEAPLTRVIGVLGLFTFIVSGVFVIADPAFLGSEDADGS